MKPIRVALVALFSIIPAMAFAQAPQRSAIASSDVLSQISMFSYTAGPESDLLFRGTPIAGTAEGKASVEFDDGNARISVKVKGLPVPTTLGPYTTYMLWALTPDGRAASQGVIAGNEGGKGELKTKYGASQFALIITAEPHFAVTAPSDMIVLYNVADKVKGEETKVTTLTERSDYSKLTPIKVDEEDEPRGARRGAVCGCDRGRCGRGTVCGAALWRGAAEAERGRGRSDREEQLGAQDDAEPSARGRDCRRGCAARSHGRQGSRG